jgi:hypothetical protein
MVGCRSVSQAPHRDHRQRGVAWRKHEHLIRARCVCSNAADHDPNDEGLRADDGDERPDRQGARRYLDAAEYSDDDTGHFYATAKRKKVVGPIGVQTSPEYFTDQTSQEAAFDALVALTGVGLSPSPKPEPTAG